jgi:magnesium transporter
MIVNQAVYEHGRRLAEPVALEDTYEQVRREGVFAWIGLLEPTEEEFESVRREFQLHELAVEDAINAHQRPKLEFYGDSLFIVLKTVRWVDTEERIELGELLIFVGDGFIVSVRHGEPSDEALKRLAEGLELDDGPTAPARVQRLGPSRIELAIHEGRKHQVKRMLEAVGHPVHELHRSRYAGLTPARLEPGEWRELEPEELELLRAAILHAR